MDFGRVFLKENKLFKQAKKPLFMLKFCLVVDTERFISFKQGNPRWNSLEKFKGRINNLIKNFRYNEMGFGIFYNTVLEQKFPVTFMLVGSLFKQIKSPNFVEWGYHTYNHIPLTLVHDDIVKRQIKNIYKAESFSPPLWMVKDSKNPERIFNFLEKEKYKNIIYKGVDYGLKHKHHFSIQKPEKIGKLRLVHVSNTFEGNSSKKHIINLIREIKNNIEKDAVYCLCTHDFTHKNNRNLLKLISFLKLLEKNKKIKIINVKNA